MIYEKQFEELKKDYILKARKLTSFLENTSMNDLSESDIKKEFANLRFDVAASTALLSGFITNQERVQLHKHLLIDAR